MSKHKLRLPRNVRSQLREYADERGMTYTEAMLDILPEDVEEERVDRGENSWIKIDTPAHERLDALTGRGVDYKDVVYHFLQKETQ